MKDILKDFDNFFNKYYKRLIEENQFDQFQIFIREKNFNLIYIDILKDISEMIENRIIKREKMDNINNSKISNSFSLKLDGSNTLKKIHARLIEFSNSNITIEKAEIEILYYYSYILKIVLNLTYPEMKITTLTKFIELVEYYNQPNNIKNYFRGQSNSSWDLVQSSLRNINRDETRIYTFEELMGSYKKLEIDEKYNRIIGEKSELDKVSFFQHSISYSPLIDFTSKIQVAAFFSMNNVTSINDFYNFDSAIYILDNYNDRLSEIEMSESDLKKLKIGIYKDGPKTSKDYLFMHEKMGEISNSLATIKFSSKKTNDRMKYQSGAFVFFNDYIIDGKNISVKGIEQKYQFTKLIIDKKVKKEVYNWLRTEYPEYNLKYLMDPYQYFNE